MRQTVRSRGIVLFAAAVVFVALLPVAASGHTERAASFPDGNGTEPRLLTSGPTLLVCKKDSPKQFATLSIPSRHRNQRLYRQCMEDGYRHIQEAVDAITRKNTRIMVLPGTYREEPSRRAHAAGCEKLGDGGNGDDRGPESLLTYGEQRKCPHVQNLIAIFGDSNGNRECDLPQCGVQIEGTGDGPDDVVIDGQFKTLNGIRADRVDGARFYNFTMQRFEFNAMYILETDGFLIDKVIGRWNDEYAFLTFAVDHGRYNRCEGYGNGDSAVYPGSASDINTGKPHSEVTRYAVHISNCRAHHNAGGYSGTAGNSVHVYNSTFDHNSTGIVTDSIYAGHPGLPQNHGYYERNEIFSNNTNYAKYVQNGTCDKPFINRGYEHGVVCPVIPTPIGTGMVIAGGNYNNFEQNNVYDNWRAGQMLIHVPAPIRDENDPDKQFDTSHNNRLRYNSMGFGPEGMLQPNGVDFWWDDQGNGNCWRGNVARSGTVTENAAPTPTNPSGELPSCPEGSQWTPGNPVKTGQIGACALYDRQDEKFRDPPNCDFFERPPRPAARQPSRPEMTRTGGNSGIRAATRVSRRAFNRANAVVIAPRSDEAAALVAAPLAGEVDGPLLLTGKRRLSRATADEVRRLDAERAYVVGHVRPRVAAMLQNAGVREVRNIKGRDRFTTAAKVARLMGGTEVYVVRGGGSGSKLSHAFAIAGLAAFQDRPILLANRKSLPSVTAAVLDDLQAVNATLLGNGKRLTDRVRKAVDRHSVIVDRIPGFTRYRLSAESATRAIKGIANERKVWVANGSSGMDSLAAASAVAHRDGVMLMVDRKSLSNSPQTRGWLLRRRLDMDDVYLVGGSRRLSETTSDQIRKVTSPQ